MVQQGIVIPDSLRTFLDGSEDMPDVHMGLVATRLSQTPPLPRVCTSALESSGPTQISQRSEGVCSPSTSGQLGFAFGGRTAVSQRAGARSSSIIPARYSIASLMMKLWCTVFRTIDHGRSATPPRCCGWSAWYSSRPTTNGRSPTSATSPKPWHCSRPPTNPLPSPPPSRHSEHSRSLTRIASAIYTTPQDMTARG